MSLVKLVFEVTFYLFTCNKYEYTVSWLCFKIDCDYSLKKEWEDDSEY